MGKQKIMVVEDEYIVAASLEACLENMGYEVSGVADSGEKAIKFSEKEPPDLVLMDIKLNGEMDGVEAAEEIMSRWNIPIIFLTAYSDEKLLERAKLVKPYGFLVKPFQNREIKATIEMALYKSGMENEIFKAKQEWEETFNLAIDLIAIIDKEFNFIRVNQAFADRLNISPDEATGKKCYELMHYRDSPPSNCPHLKVLEGNTSHKGES